MQYFNPINFVGAAILGAALLWAVKLAYGGRRTSSHDIVKRLMLLAGWILLLTGTLGVVVGFSGPLAVMPLLGAGLAVEGYFKYITAERRSLLWALAVAAEKDIPLEQAARAFADERAVQIGSRVSHLADLLESGVPLPTALTLTRNPLPADALLAVRLGFATGRLGPALRMSIRHSDLFERTMREVLERFAYLAGVLLAGTLVVHFVMLKIVPVFAKMFAEFDLELPTLTQWNIAIAEQAVYGIPFVYPAIAIILLLALSYFLRWSRYELPGFSWFWLRSDAALVTRALSFAVQTGRELGPAVRLLAAQYPRPSVGKRLERAAAGIDQGMHWCDALQSMRLLTPTDVGLLKAAERVGNLAWALEEISEGNLRRWSLRWKIGVNIGFPLLILALGLVVMFIVVGLFIPLVSMIQGLS
jgi:type II secretory pathway component PulF